MSQEKFIKMLDRVPRIRSLWNKSGLNVEAFEKSLGVMSSSEAAMAQFFASVWFNDNKRYGFDIVDAVARIDDSERKIIIEWIADPFWP